MVHVRARKFYPFFKIVLITNGSGLDNKLIQEGLQYFTADDEIWIKLDAGSQSYMDKVNRAEVPLEKIVGNTLLIGRQRPIIIQSLFPAVNGQEPEVQEIDEYISLLNRLKNDGAQISLVLIYSATRPIAHPECSHLRLKESFANLPASQSGDGVDGGSVLRLAAIICRWVSFVSPLRLRQRGGDHTIGSVFGS